jgi:hypothetical protein
MWVAWFRTRGDARWERTCQAERIEDASREQNRILGRCYPTWCYCLTQGGCPTFDTPPDCTSSLRTQSEQVG